MISGSRPRQLMKGQKLRYATYDGRLSDLESDEPLSFIWLISASAKGTFTWRGQGPVPTGDIEKLKTVVRRAHAGNCKIRFWATLDEASPARTFMWKTLLDNGVDFLNTDDLVGLRSFLLDYYAK